MSDPHGEFKGENIFFNHSDQNLSKTASQHHLTEEMVSELLKSARNKLFERRKSRPKPHLDDKIIVAWNGLCISTFSKAYQILRNPIYLESTLNAARFICENLINSEGHLLRSFR